MDMFYSLGYVAGRGWIGPLGSSDLGSLSGDFIRTLAYEASKGCSTRARHWLDGFEDGWLDADTVKRPMALLDSQLTGVA